MVLLFSFKHEHVIKNLFQYIGCKLKHVCHQRFEVCERHAVRLNAKPSIFFSHSKDAISNARPLFSNPYTEECCINRKLVNNFEYFHSLAWKLTWCWDCNTSNVWLPSSSCFHQIRAHFFIKCPHLDEKTVIDTLGYGDQRWLWLPWTGWKLRKCLFLLIRQILSGTL